MEIDTNSHGIVNTKDTTMINQTYGNLVEIAKMETNLIKLKRVDLLMEDLVSWTRHSFYGIIKIVQSQVLISKMTAN